MKGIKLAEDLTLPVEAATQTLLVVGKRGSGKTNTCGVLAEQFHHAGVPFVVIDPADVWWGLKSSKDGKSAGLPVYVFGGRHADIPLEPTAGILIADLLVERHITAVISVKHLSGRERGRLVGDLCKRLFQRNETAFHVFLEEAHEVAPQNPYKGEEEMLGHVARIWKLGRSSGLGGSAITQRPASLNKNITTQAEILIVHRTIGPQDIAAIREWIKYHGESDSILSQLSGLKTGEAFIWAPDFPEDKPIGLRKISVNMRETYDSSSTPKAGQDRAEPKKLAAVDLEAIRSKMSETIERAKAEDPKELKKQIAELKRANLLMAETIKKEALRSVRVKTETKIERVEVPILKDSQIKQLEAIADRYEKESLKLGEVAMIIRACVKDAISSAKPLTSIATNTPKRVQVQRVASDIRRDKTAIQKYPIESNGSLPIGETKTLAALIQYPNGLQRRQLTTLTGYKRSSRDAYIYRLTQKEYAEVSGDRVVATEKGISALPGYEPLPSGTELQQYWLTRLPQGERAVLEVLIQEYPESVQRDEITNRTGYQRSSRDAYLYRLRAKELVIEIGRGEVRASEDLFQ